MGEMEEGLPWFKWGGKGNRATGAGNELRLLGIFRDLEAISKGLTVKKIQSSRLQARIGGET